MNLLLLLPGLLLMVLLAYDLIYTTFAPRGAGPITNSITSFIWAAYTYYYRRIRKNKGLAGAGVVIVCATLLNWVLLLWLSNILIFSSDSIAVVDANTEAAATLKDRIYFTGYILSTMGNGDFKAGTDGWSIYSAFVSFFGIIMITIAISYMVPILTAVTDRRTLSIQIATLGHSPEDILLNHWNGKNFKNLDDGLQDMITSIIEQGQLHLSYPVLNYFHSNDKVTALPPNLASLDEALSILFVYFPKDTWPSFHIMRQTRRAISSFLVTVDENLVKSSQHKAAPLMIDQLRKQPDLPIMEASEDIYEQLEYRRCVITAMVEDDGWDWEDINLKVFNKKIDAVPGF